MTPTGSLQPVLPASPAPQGRRDGGSTPGRPQADGASARRDPGPVTVRRGTLVDILA